MRVVYTPHSQKAWENFLSIQSGHGMVGYRGSAYQRGSGIGNLLGGLFRSFLPVAKSIGKTVGKQALKTGAEVAADALGGRDIGEAFEERGKAGASRLLAKGVKKLGNKKKSTAKTRKNQKKKGKPQKGGGLGIRPKSKSTTGSLKGVVRGKNVSRKKKQFTDQLGVYVA